MWKCPLPASEIPSKSSWCSIFTTSLVCVTLSLQQEWTKTKVEPNSLGIWSFLAPVVSSQICWQLGDVAWFPHTSGVDGLIVGKIGETGPHFSSCSWLVSTSWNVTGTGFQEQQIPNCHVLMHFEPYLIYICCWSPTNASHKANPVQYQVKYRPWVNFEFQINEFLGLVHSIERCIS